MALDDIIRKIKKEAEEKMAEILKTAEEEKKKILKEAREKATEEKKNVLAQGRKEAEEVKNRIITLVRLDSRKAFLSDKRRLLDEVFDVALKEFLSLNEEKKKSLYKKILLQINFDGRNELIISGKEKGSFKEIIKYINHELKKNGKKAEMVLSKEERSLNNGFILKSGRKEINCTLRTIFDSQRETYELEVAKILFSI